MRPNNVDRNHLCKIYKTALADSNYCFMACLYYYQQYIDLSYKHLFYTVDSRRSSLFSYLFHIYVGICFAHIYEKVRV